jgi:hypothetical protein
MKDFGYGGFMNCSIPRFFAKLRAEFAYNLEKGHGGFINVAVFGICAIPETALTFHVLTDTGAQIGRVPIHALCWSEEAPSRSLETLELWNVMSPYVSVVQYEYLQAMTCYPYLKTGEKVRGEYMLTVDWFGTEVADEPGDGGWKCGHLIKLDEGNFCLQPNNRIYPWVEPATIRPEDELPDYITNTHEWDAEGESKWITEDSNRQFYKVEDADSEQPNEKPSRLSKCPGGDIRTSGADGYAHGVDNNGATRAPEF